MDSISDRLAGTAAAGAIDARAQDAAPDRPVLTRALSLPAAGVRELRLDLFRGLALWLIFIDHVSPDLLSWFTIRSYGFSDAAEIFIFISGYTAAFVYGRSLLESGFVIAAARILRRVWQIYSAHILLFTIMVAEVSWVAIGLEKPFYAEEVAITDFFKQPGISMVQALLLRYRPLNMDVLPLYIVLMAFLPLILLLIRWSALRGCLAVRSAFYGLSERLLVLQSLCVANAVRVRRLVRARRHQKDVGIAVVTDYAVDFVGLSAGGVLRHPDLVLPAAGARDAALARAADLSDQQDRPGPAQVRALSGAGVHGLFCADGAFRRSFPACPGRRLRAPDHVGHGMAVHLGQAQP
jgi:hypothetical protein